MIINVVLDNIRSIYNVGSIFRTSSGAGTKKIILLGITPTPDDVRISKTALGAEKELFWTYFYDYKEFYLQNKTKGVFIAVEQHPSKSLPINVIYQTIVKNTKYQNKEIFFIFGNEITGVSNEVIDTSDFICELPMLGIKNSLNVSNTVAIVLYYFLLKNLER